MSPRVQAEFSPLVLTDLSFNADVVVEVAAPKAPAPVTTASMDSGTNNTGFSWYERGYNVESPDTGLPEAGTTVISETLPDHQYTFAASYTAPNAVLIDNAAPNAVLTLTTPAAYSALSFLASAGAGTATVAYAVIYADGTTNSGTFVAADWFNGEDVAVTSAGRLNVLSRAFDGVGGANPRLYSADVTLPASTSPVTRVELSYSAGGGHAAIFALSGSTGTDFTPISFTGYTQDLVVESGSPPGLNGLEATTATMDAGVGNTGATWYEQGYNAAASLTGLPPAGSVLTNTAAQDHRYVLAPSYTNNNVALLDADNPVVTLTPATPAAQSALSFLTSAGGGAVTVDFEIVHADDTRQTGSFVSPDWFNNTPFAYVTQGRVNAVAGGLDSVNTQNPRLYAVDVAVQNTTSPISAITLTLQTGTGHAAFFAVSGATGSVQPIVDTQPASVATYAGSDVEFSAVVSGSLPLVFRWQKETDGAFVDLADGGNISGATTATLRLAAVVASDAANYRLAITNATGSAASQPATLTVLSTASDVTSPEDAIEIVGGNSPAAEAVAMAIDGTTSKYLNFGLDGDTAAPFVGPVGLLVTPAVGSTVVTGLRVFTANDAVERDPSDFLLEGSNDGGTTFVTVASGPLSLPDARNAGALDLDPLTQAVQEVSFANTAAFTTYRLTFAHVKDAAAANSVQLGEIELLGSAAGNVPVLTLSTGPGEGSFTLTTTLPGALQFRAALNDAGSWQDEGAIESSRTITPSESQRFYRVVTP
ncbi:MAG: immunoglobulin domain-containing protein [Verrucomicrobiae bacterium]|nr:immunoglobulin domain-containing protein [Verrucomicrobiae bacterium]